MGTIRDLSIQSFNRGLPRITWRDELLPANFDGYPFHVEAAGRDSGRRIALHEFPKKELPYAEDMGRIARSFSVRGYIIVYPHSDSTTPRAPNGIETLYQHDYRNARDQLIERLETGGPGPLQLPTFTSRVGPLIVVCTKFRVTEEVRTGGYCVFDMSFVERGKRPFAEAFDTQGDLYSKTLALRQQVASVWAAETASAQKVYLGPIKPGTTSPASEFTARSTGRASALMGPFNPLRRFIGSPKKHGPLKPVTTGPESEFTTRSTGQSSAQMRRFKTKITSSPPIPGF